MLARLALPKCKSYHWWHNTRLKGKGLQNKEREKGDKSKGALGIEAMTQGRGGGGLGVLKKI